MKENRKNKKNKSKKKKIKLNLNHNTCLKHSVKKTMKHVVPHGQINAYHYWFLFVFNFHHHSLASAGFLCMLELALGYLAVDAKGVRRHDTDSVAAQEGRRGEFERSVGVSCGFSTKLRGPESVCVARQQVATTATSCCSDAQSAVVDCRPET